MSVCLSIKGNVTGEKYDVDKQDSNTEKDKEAKRVTRRRLQRGVNETSSTPVHSPSGSNNQAGNQKWTRASAGLRLTHSTVAGGAPIPHFQACTQSFKMLHNLQFDLQKKRCALQTPTPTFAQKKKSHNNQNRNCKTAIVKQKQSQETESERERVCRWDFSSSLGCVFAPPVPSFLRFPLLGGEKCCADTAT